MKNYAIELSYDGGAFKGWQSQPQALGVQDAVESALLALDERSRVHGAGRTDAGVHARAQVANVFLKRDWNPRKLVLALNTKLPPSVSVMRAAAVPDDFHARFSAVSREYRFFIWNSSTCYPHIRPYVLWCPGGYYDWSIAARTAKLLEGEHDFRAFCRANDCPEKSVRKIKRARLTTKGDLVIFTVEANSFLTNMIRIMLGNLLEVARGARDESWFLSLLNPNSHRSMSAKTLLPTGLFFWRARYSCIIDWNKKQKRPAKERP